MHPDRIQQLVVIVAPLLYGLAAHAGELVYAPVSPAFGGANGNAAQVWLSTAQATNKHKPPVEPIPGLTGQSGLQQFNDMLERTVLGQLASAATSSILGPDGKLIPGTVDTGSFRITITDLGGGVLQITTTDKNTGASTSFEIGGNGS
jgi:curli production assembly/transport component CsgF